MAKIVSQYNPDIVSPPGAIILESIEVMGMTQTELAEKMVYDPYGRTFGACYPKHRYS